MIRASHLQTFKFSDHLHWQVDWQYIKCYFRLFSSKLADNMTMLGQETVNETESWIAWQWLWKRETPADGVVEDIEGLSSRQDWGGGTSLKVDPLLQASDQIIKSRILVTVVFFLMIRLDQIGSNWGWLWWWQVIIVVMKVMIKILLLNEKYEKNLA